MSSKQPNSTGWISGYLFRPHPAPAEDEMEQRFQTKRVEWEQGYQDGGSAVQHDLNLIEHEAARKAREEVLKELGTMLNSRIAKMEILDSKNPSPLRKGILLAYRDIEEWERKQSLRQHSEESER